MRKPKQPERTRAAIIVAALEEFARRGTDGARLDAVAQRTGVTRGMVYYYFKSRHGLYMAVLRYVYEHIRAAEQALDLERCEPDEAIRRLVAFSFDYYQRHPLMPAIVSGENRDGGANIRKLYGVRALNAPIIATIERLLARGVERGVFRSGVDPVDLHMTITALAWYPVTNRYTFGHVFGRDMTSSRQLARHRRLVTDVVLRYLTSGADCPRAWSADCTPIGRRLGTGSR
jgi:AcrR family transcriptional regulator